MSVSSGISQCESAQLVRFFGEISSQRFWTAVPASLGRLTGSCCLGDRWRGSRFERAPSETDKPISDTSKGEILRGAKDMRQQYLYYQLLKFSGQGTSAGDALDKAVDRLCESQLLELSEVPVKLRLTALKQVCQVIALL